MNYCGLGVEFEDINSFILNDFFHCNSNILSDKQSCRAEYTITKAFPGSISPSIDTSNENDPKLLNYFTLMVAPRLPT